MGKRRRVWVSWIGLLALLAGSLGGMAPPRPAVAAHTPDPASVTVAGSLQSALGCAGDWQPECAATHLTYEAADDVWQGSWTVPAGIWEFKAAVNDSWDQNYGQNAQQNGANLSLSLGTSATVKFYYDHKSHWVTSSHNAVIATVAGSFQSELGCGGDWDPGCLQSWLQDPDGNGVYSFATDGIPIGDYEAKVALSESWDLNYGEGGVQNGPNIPFSVPADGLSVGFEYDSNSHVLTIAVEPSGHAPDNNVEYFGLGHDSQDSLYRVPFGAITPGTPLILRFRTYHDDVTGVRVRFWNDAAGQQFFRDMELAAADVSCYDPDQPDETCDLWQTTYTPTQPTTLYYRFIVSDGAATAYYADDSFQDGGWGQATPNLIDNSYAVTVYQSTFQPIEWMQNGIVYQIFPDRFRNGRANNDPDPGEPRYGYPGDPLDQISQKGWDELPEGYCRAYQSPAEPCTESPRGRDYYGGDLRGVLARLNYLKDLGVTVIYFNPIFESGSNHGYDTQDYYQIDHFFGTQKEFDDLVGRAGQLGIRVVLDGVFNHVSSDSPYFDRYGHYDTVGACESLDSPYRSWFYFHDVTPGTGKCAGPGGDLSAGYDAWFGFDSIPVLNKSNPEVKDLIYAAPDAVARYWLGQGAAGWRLDVMGDTSFPAGFWADFRSAVKATRPDAPIIGELWKKHEVLTRVRGDQADTAMNYRFRNAILGFFGTVDHKGFADDGQSDQPPSLLARKLNSVREDYPDAAYYTLLNLMDSHDTQRILWSLTPGAGNRESRELDAASLAQGKELLKLATVVQMTVPGAPTIYYGDEIGLTGDDDPDDRRTFPWLDDDAAQFGAGGDPDLLAHYKQLIALRAAQPVFRSGNLTFLLTDDDHRTMAYLMRTADAGAIVAINRSSEPQTLTMELGGRLPDNVQLSDALGTIGPVAATSGTLTFDLPGLSAAVLLPEAGQDLLAPGAPSGLAATEENAAVSLTWNAVAGAAGYRVYRSPVTGGGYVLVGQAVAPEYTDTEVVNGRAYYYVVTAVDAAGNEGPYSNQRRAQPHDVIGWANLQWPPTLDHTISAQSRTGNVYGQVWIDGVTGQPGATPMLLAQLGFGPDGSNPSGHPDWVWADAAFHTDAGNNDEFVASLLPEAVGTYDYAYRYSITGGSTWVYADLDGAGNGYSPDQAGSLTVSSSGDVTAPDPPAGLRVISADPAAIALAWDDVTGDPSLHGYEVRRSTVPGGPYTTLAPVSAAAYTDTAVDEGATYYYVVRSVDTSFNRSAHSAEVAATASPRTVTLVFTVTVPADTDSTGRSVFIAGTLHLLDGGLPEWNPGGVAMTRVDATHWTITLTGTESATIEYKYALGSWDYVEKGGACEEVANRTLTLFYGSTGTQTVTDTVQNWRNVAPCGN